MTYKSFVLTGGQLVSVTTDFVRPPIGDRNCDWVAHYTDDQSDDPNCGWGATPEAAINDLTDNYDPQEAK